MSDSLLQELRQEAVRRRPDARTHERQYLATGGAVADALATAQHVVDFVAASAGSVTATGVASYLFYDEPGLGIDPHIDTDVFAINMIMMLRHDDYGEDRSALVIHLPGQAATRVELDPGELVILNANAVVHGRTRVGPGECVHVLTIGFNPSSLAHRPFTL